MFTYKQSYEEAFLSNSSHRMSGSPYANLDVTAGRTVRYIMAAKL